MTSTNVSDLYPSKYMAYSHSGPGETGLTEEDGGR